MNKEEISYSESEGCRDPECEWQGPALCKSPAQETSVNNV